MQYMYIYDTGCPLTWQQDDSRRGVESISVPVSVEVIKVHIDVRCHHRLNVLLLRWRLGLLCC